MSGNVSFFKKISQKYFSVTTLCFYYFTRSLLVLFFVLSIVVLLRTLLVKPNDLQNTVLGKDWSYILSNDELGSRLQQSIKFRTISDKPDHAEFYRFVDFIKKSFPAVHSSHFIDIQTIGNTSLLYFIKGSDVSLNPYLLLGHLDVVPVEYDKWTVDPFSGEVIDDFLYGRGTIDNKYAVMGIMEALEFLIKENFQPKRSFYIAFGDDEETDSRGAKAIAEMLQKNNVQLEFVLDEGIFILPGSTLLIDIDNVAIISVTEKGFLTVNLSVSCEAGHSSLSQVENSAVILSKAVAKLNGNCLPNIFGSGPEWNFFEGLASHVNFLKRILFANMWLFHRLIGWLIATNPATNPMTRTTTSVTMLHSGYKDNVIPSTAWAMVNFRIHPSSSVTEVVEDIRRILNDERVHIQITDAHEPHPVSPHGEFDFGYQTIKQTVEQIYRNTAVVPGVMMATTDSTYYLPLTKAVYRFGPIQLSLADAVKVHGHDERIPLQSYKRGVVYYYQLIENSDQSNLKLPHLHSTEL